MSGATVCGEKIPDCKAELGLLEAIIGFFVVIMVLLDDLQTGTIDLN